jgi:NAD+ diphosphatase
MNQMNDVAFDLGPKPDLAYGGSAIERAAERRGDAAFLTALERADACVTYAVAGELIILRKDESGFSPAYTAAAAAALGRIDHKIFLGLRGDCGCFGVGIDPQAVERLKADDNFFLTDLRSVAIQGLVSFEDLPPLAEAKSLLHWNARHRYCANCGAMTKMTDGGWRRDCPQCQAQHFPRTDPVAIMLTIDGERCLLGRQSRFVEGMWSCLAGFAEPGESIEETVRRETLEEAGIRCGRVRYFGSQPWPFPSSLMIGCHAQALSREIRVDHNELEDARWFSRRDAALMLTRKHPDGLTTPPPFAIAHHIIRDWVEHGDGLFA